MLNVEINDIIFKYLKNNKIPWYNQTGIPCNIINNKRYSGINVLLLNISSINNNWIYSYWGTYNQWTANGWKPKQRPDNIKIGDWATQIYFKDKNNLIKYSVFNLDQINAGFNHLRKPLKIDFQNANNLIRSLDIKVKHIKTDKAYYSYENDVIILPNKDNFLNEESYYYSFFHELGHSTERKLDCKLDYVDCELRAEMIAGMLSSYFHLPEIKLINCYLEQWLNKFDNDYIFNIALSASNAVDYLLKVIE